MSGPDIGLLRRRRPAVVCSTACDVIDSPASAGPRGHFRLQPAAVAGSTWVPGPLPERPPYSDMPCSPRWCAERYDVCGGKSALNCFGRGGVGGNCRLNRRVEDGVRWGSRRGTGKREKGSIGVMRHSSKNGEGGIHRFFFPPAFEITRLTCPVQFDRGQRNTPTQISRSESENIGTAALRPLFLLLPWFGANLTRTRPMSHMHA